MKIRLFEDEDSTHSGRKFTLMIHLTRRRRDVDKLLQNVDTIITYQTIHQKLFK